MYRSSLDNPSGIGYTSHMNYREYHEFQEAAWDRLPFWQRRLAVERLRAAYSDKFFDELGAKIREKGLGHWLPLYFHATDGMVVRNVLRSNHTGPATLRRLHTIPDDQLPSTVYGDHPGFRNWDDYYIQVLEAAAGFRPIEDWTPWVWPVPDLSDTWEGSPSA
jgi:hypothetical protein